MAKRIVGTTPRQDGYRMPGEFEEQTGVWMLWPQRPDNWRGGAKPAQQAFADVARAIARFEPVTVLRESRPVPERPGPAAGGHPGGGDDQQRRLGPGLRPHLCEKRSGGPTGGGLDLQRLGRPA
ncbi:MAG: agmatine deiminase family protein [Oscillospiraceae bacterium]